MASRAGQRQAPRDAPLRTEQPSVTPPPRRGRLGAAAGVAAVAVIVAVVAILISAGGPERAGLRSGSAGRVLAAAVARELRGLPQSGVTLGNARAPVTLEYFGDLECPVCRAFTLGADGGGLPQLIAGPVRAGQVKLVYRSLETASQAVNADRFVPQQVAAYAAGVQHRAWNYIELFYREQGSEDSRYVTEAFLRGLARQIDGLRLGLWLTDRQRPAWGAEVAADERAALADGLPGTPTLVARGPRHTEIVPAGGGIPDFSAIMSAIRAVR